LCLIALHGTLQVTAQGSCEQIDVPPVCQGGGRININTNSYNISPLNLCASPGKTIAVNVTPAGIEASIYGKNGGWPGGSGASFAITAPNGGEYNYNMSFADDTCIDPRITVK